MKVIALSGWKGSGKDAVAEYLVKNHRFKRVALADLIKDQTAKDYNVPRDWFDSNVHKEAPLFDLPVVPKDKTSLEIVKLLLPELKSNLGNAPDEFCYNSFLNGYEAKIVLDEKTKLTTNIYWTPRALCILKGSTVRAIDPDYWSKIAIEKINKTSKLRYRGVVISDLRYISEDKFLRRKLNGNHNYTCVRINRFRDITTTDSSERDLDDYEFDYIIENKKTLDDLYDQVDRLIKEN